MRVITKEISYNIAGGIALTSIDTIGDIIIVTVSSGAEFRFNGCFFSEGMRQGDIYNGYQVVFKPNGFNCNGTTTFGTVFILTPIK